VIRPARRWRTRALELTRLALAEGAAHVVTDHYRHPDVRAALERLFHDKCAYCETPIGAGGDWDVEHYRPKGRVAERRDHPGYYWLAYTWTNLYPACALCNQRRKDAPRWDDLREFPAQGKVDQFPVADEAHRALAPGAQLAREQPLLIDPCRPDAEGRFAYGPQGDIRPSAGGDRAAAETIRICHLERRRLRDARARVILRAARIVARIEEARRSGNADAVRLLGQALDLCASETEPYAGVARAVRRDPEAFAGV
jgi:uncharacterized protein (TIGR02646 family)